MEEVDMGQGAAEDSFVQLGPFASLTQVFADPSEFVSELSPLIELQQMPFGPSSARAFVGCADEASDVMVSGLSEDDVLVTDLPFFSELADVERFQDLGSINEQLIFQDHPDLHDEHLEDVMEVIGNQSGEEAPSKLLVPGSPGSPDPTPAGDGIPRRSSRRAPSTAAAAATTKESPARSASRAPTKKRVERDLVFKCEQCGHTSKTRELLRRHERVHTGPTKKCPECGKMFGQRNNLTRHMRTKHNVDSQGNEAPDMTKCDFEGCTFQTHRKDKLKDHIVAMHPREPKLTCGVSIYKTKNQPCRFVCFTPETMLNHRTVDHRHLPRD
ncbi:hypothetical protein ONE63_007822 [Megalurothrips usitatus]|uniref:C2H2-type domain-containing protein n=1 Tax=Megalurothrips usitatus TaxID=439358 RepID=A0AAV7XT40_9NEOP|nr:hypothetical protein ONE63_007822 [Megalurothrips usitatus]